MSDRSLVIIGTTALFSAIFFYSLGKFMTSDKGPSFEAKKKLHDKKKACGEMRDTSVVNYDQDSLDLDIRRQFQIINHGASDHSGECIAAYVSDFDMNKTIFGSMEGVLPRLIVKSRMAVDLYWSDRAIAEASRKIRQIPKAPRFDNGIINFMKTECNFAMEHADGSFMDHLKFCHDYSAIHYKDQSPIPLFLHSIMGVGTNFFPMEKSKIKMLQEIVSPDDFKQIECFPSVLRLIYGTDFLDQLLAEDRPLTEIQEIKVHRVIDNETVSMTGDELRIAMNYQLIHLLDFLPAASWLSQINDLFLMTMAKLYSLMEKDNLIDAKVDFDLSSGERTSDGVPVSVGSILSKFVPGFVKKKMQKKAMQKYSANIGHCLTYTLVWKGSSEVIVYE